METRIIIALELLVASTVIFSSLFLLAGSPVHLLRAARSGGAAALQRLGAARALQDCALRETLCQPRALLVSTNDLFLAQTFFAFVAFCRR